MADFQQNKTAFDPLDTRIVALSADREDEARGTVERLGLEFTLLYGLDPEATSRAIGCYTGMHEGRPHIQPAGFVLGPTAGWSMRCIPAAGSAGSRPATR